MKRKEPSLTTQGELAMAYDVSPATIQLWAKRGMPGRPGSYKLGRISRWLRERNVGPFRGEKTAEPGDPLLAAEVDSPGLERYRLAKAALAELELEERKGSLIPLEKVRDMLGRWSSLIRRMGESLTKRFGKEAAELLNDTLDECRRVVPSEAEEDASTD